MAITTGVLRVERVAVKKIKAAAYNPRKDLRPGDPEYEKIKRSIAEFGYVDTLVWNKRSGNLVGGHQRLKVLRNEFGVKAVDVSVVDLPPAREKALNVALNKIAGQWDIAALADLLGAMQDEGADATLTGFDAAEIDAAIAEATAAGKPEDEAAESLNEASISNIPAVLVICESVKDQKATAKELQRQGHQCKMTRV